ncbi:hypothetical protein NC653_001522 [Populus alba x Populus x berolinensis]|uniref:50S ribosomal protein L14 n=1 Tax=Populus alba x Populus x berolinensis TaxID=444605 RepID=A0AAD6RLN6_9ROSI|nr:hypothetical protein NC653_001522 [Populus alba x Populus x berolinensis]
MMCRKIKLGGHRLLGGLDNNVTSLLSTSNQMTWSDFLSQGKKGDVHATFEGEVARLVDTIIASVKVAIPIGKVKKGKVVSRVAVHAAIHRGRFDGIEVKFDDNAVVIIDKEGQPKGSRVFGPVPHELRKKRHDKTLALAELIA